MRANGLRRVSAHAGARGTRAYARRRDARADGSRARRGTRGTAYGTARGHARARTRARNGTKRLHASTRGFTVGNGYGKCGADK